MLRVSGSGCHMLWLSYLGGLRVWERGEGGGELLVDVAEASVGEDGDDVAGAELRGEVGDDGVGVGVESGGDAAGVECGDDVLRVEALGGWDAFGLEDGGEDDAVGEGEAFDELGFEDVAAEGVGARFEDGPEALAGVGLAEGAEGFADGGGVVCEVVDDGDVVDDGADFETALNALEGCQGFYDSGGGDALACRERGGGGGVEGVVLAGHGEGEFGEGLAGPGARLRGISI
jgi:hypothetical protein